MFISDAFLHLRQTLEGEATPVIEFEDYFAPFIAGQAFDITSRYFAAASCFLLLQLCVWEGVVVAVDDPALATSIVDYDHTVVGLDARPLPAAFEASKLPVADGQLRLSLTPLADARAFVTDLAPRPFLFVLASGAEVALAALAAWRGWADPTSSLALLIKAPPPDVDPLMAAIREVHHRVAGWLSVPTSNGHADVVAMFVFGAGCDEI